MPHVVIVEDDRLNARLFEAVLRRLGGFEVTVTEDVEELLRLASAHKADLIIMDVSLSNCRYQGHPVDGLEITRLLKGNPGTSGIPVILATAHAMRGDRERFLAQSYADDYLAKPIMDQAAFIATINGHLERCESSKRV
ncbi:MAG TPA: response regulator [Planctomycetota bacterium]|nr:response regulator [Planctomycetota bacterium]